MANTLTLLLAFLVAVHAVSGTCPYPNGTATALHTYNCASLPLYVNSTEVYDSDGNVNYPLDPKKPMVLVLKTFNFNSKPYTADVVNVTLAQYSSDWLTGKCGWHVIPTFGILNNIDGCSFAKNCPMAVGEVDLTLSIDLSPFAAIIDVLTGHNAYQLEIQMFDRTPGDPQDMIACAVSQLRFDV